MGLAASKQEAFWEACGFGDKTKVRRYISEGIDVNWISYTHNSCPIHVASQGKQEIVQMLLDARCNVNAKDDRGNLALHHAAMKGHSEIIQMLIEAGSHKDEQDKNGWTALINAAYFCQPKAVRTLLENDSDVHLQNKDNRTALHESCRSQSMDEDGLFDIAEMLISAGSDINSKSSDIGEADFTPLMFCAYHGHAKLARALINAKCNINAQGTNLWTALHWAVDRNHDSVARVLLQANVDTNIRALRGEFAIDRARCVEMKELLEQHNGFLINSEKLSSSSPDGVILRSITDAIQQTAEGHKILVEEIERRERMYEDGRSRCSVTTDENEDDDVISLDDNNDVISLGSDDAKDRDSIDPQSSKDRDSISSASNYKEMSDNKEISLNHRNKETFSSTNQNYYSIVDINKDLLNNQTSLSTSHVDEDIKLGNVVGDINDEAVSEITKKKYVDATVITNHNKPLITNGLE